MADQFKPALPLPVKFSTSENEYDDAEKFPKAMSLFVPLESIQPLCDHMIKLGDTKTKTGKVVVLSSGPPPVRIKIISNL